MLTAAVASGMSVTVDGAAGIRCALAGELDAGVDGAY